MLALFLCLALAIYADHEENGRRQWPGDRGADARIKEEREGKLRQRMRRTGRFEYHASLPRDVQTDTAEASLERGLLIVRIPKGEQAKRRHIEVKG